jgi:hypothetical protein
MFSDRYKTHKYSVGRALSCSMLNCSCITWPVDFKRLNAVVSLKLAELLYGIVKFPKRTSTWFRCTWCSALSNTFYRLNICRWPTGPIRPSYLPAAQEFCGTWPYGENGNDLYERYNDVTDQKQQSVHPFCGERHWLLDFPPGYKAVINTEAAVNIPKELWQRCSVL